MKMIYKNCLIFLLLTILGFSCSTSKTIETDAELLFTQTIPMANNSWTTTGIKTTNKVVTKGGIGNWNNTKDKIETYFYTEETGKIDLLLALKVNEGSSNLTVSLGNQKKKVSVNNINLEQINVGNFDIKTPGYQRIEISGSNTENQSIAEIKSLILKSNEVEKITFIDDEEIYFSRRGPSVHLNYELPEQDIEYFYSEITVENGNDVKGSYFMANGFQHGYFGIQVNSDTERRILFSVWSPFKTNNPSEIPDDYKIEMLGKGDGVHTGKFGNEGSGGQSYLVYDWKPDQTYQFLLKGSPNGDDSTTFTAYFKPKNENKWMLIASFKRPYTDDYLQRFHSFLENFIPATGNKYREANFENQWACDKSGNWSELTNARFTADATAHKGRRLDYGGGSKENKFFMRNCGFFSDGNEYNTAFERKPNNIAPKIKISELPIPTK